MQVDQCPMSDRSSRRLIDAIVVAQSEGSIRPGDPSAICEILVDLLEDANNRVRLREGVSRDVPTPRQLFDRRWDVFMSAMARLP
jgi:hypothetical protein